MRHLRTACVVIGLLVIPALWGVPTAAAQTERDRDGKPVLHGTRKPVAILVGNLAGRTSLEDIEREYDPTAEHVRAALPLLVWKTKSSTVRCR